MGKRSHRRERKAGFAWPMLAFGGILLIVAAFLFANRGGSAAGETSTSDGSGTPKIAVDPAKIDYGYVKFGNDETFRIKVTNNGNGVLRFKDQPYIEVLEGC